MKYLKKYESYSDNINYDIITDYIKDICLELSDDNFNIEVVEPNYKNLMRLQICIILSHDKIKADLFKLGDIKDTILRIGDYLNQYGFIISEIVSLADILDNGIHKQFKPSLSFSVEEWDDNLDVLLLHIYYDIKS
jgi:hypothetical protein